MSPPYNVIHIAAAVIRDDTGRFLLVRKRGAKAFMQAGGKIEPGEAPVRALARELQEELGAHLTEADARYMGRFSAPAANERGHVVEAELFDVALPGPFAAGAEIDELLWFDPADPGDVLLAPLSHDHVVAGLRRLDQRRPQIPLSMSLNKSSAR